MAQPAAFSVLILLALTASLLHVCKGCSDKEFKFSRVCYSSTAYGACASYLYTLPAFCPRAMNNTCSVITVAINSTCCGSGEDAVPPIAYSNSTSTSATYCNIGCCGNVTYSTPAFCASEGVCTEYQYGGYGCCTDGSTLISAEYAGCCAGYIYQQPSFCPSSANTCYNNTGSTCCSGNPTAIPYSYNSTAYTCCGGVTYNAPTGPGVCTNSNCTTSGGASCAACSTISYQTTAFCPTAGTCTSVTSGCCPSTTNGTIQGSTPSSYSEYGCCSGYTYEQPAFCIGSDNTCYDYAQDTSLKDSGCCSGYSYAYPYSYASNAYGCCAGILYDNPAFCATDGLCTLATNGSCCEGGSLPYSYTSSYGCCNGVVYSAPSTNAGSEGKNNDMYCCSSAEGSATPYSGEWLLPERRSTHRARTLWDCDCCVLQWSCLLSRHGQFMHVHRH